jgi:hypothetical protein
MPTMPTMNPQEAHNTLYQRVHVPVFFNKLASDFGIVPQNEQEAYDMLTIAGKLRTLYDNEKQAKVKAASSKLSKLNADLDAELAKLGQAPEPQVNQAVKQASTELLRDPSIVASVLTLMQAAAAA